MKHLIYFLLFTSAVFSQNYHYALDEAPVQTPPVTPPGGVNNQQEEIDYFNAYLLPIAQKATLQAALDKYGSVRLESGDYTGTAITMKSNYRLYGHPATTGVPYITIASGSTNVVLQSLRPLKDQWLNITLQAGALISNSTLKTIKNCKISAVNATLENNNFINITGQINFDCTSSGYFRNNKIIKHQSQGSANMLVMRGNNATPSYENVVVHTNYLGSIGNTSDLNNLKSATFIGLDSETYAGTDRALFYAQNIGDLKLASISGGLQFTTPYGYFDIDAANFYNIYNGGNTIEKSVISPRTNFFSLFAYAQPLRGSGTVTGFDLHLDTKTNDLVYNKAAQTGTITDAGTITKLSDFILGTKKTPWARPNLETLPDPLGANWKTERVGKPDQTAYIQNLINTNGIADLPEGVFYISSTLHVPLDSNHGIIGKGTGKTVIVGLKDDFPLISVGSQGANKYGNIVLSNITLQGGSVGVYFTTTTMMVAYQDLKYVVFRDQNHGIQLRQIFGLDNCFFEHIAFVNCNKGFFQDPMQPYTDVNGSSYVDKTVFYQSQFLNCQTGVSMLATRADNLDAWIDCKFSGGGTALNIAADATVIANCDFTNYTGTNVISANAFSIYSSNFSGNNTSGPTLSVLSANIEGCNFLDKANLFTPYTGQNLTNYIINSTVTGNVLANSQFKPQYIIAMNSNLLANPTFSKLLVNVNGGVPTVILNAAVNPYPQFLVSQ
ncbi:hypothetical protein HYN56_22385 [Flavobacterium crocinum]|uniref:Uncharacterized protein n=1 Tax=Flavobacterium crocinum TaxID=2183896 RepID=A0A2S1YRV4_9FLAO|nr:hypothetical protein [Flavobacterium crocinum]AWK06830.1 hypothetical protein HYN56_22385 [Flavobacterium crocinum]